MLLYVFIVAVVNLCLGYALAVYVAPRLGLTPSTRAAKSPPGASAAAANTDSKPDVPAPNSPQHLTES